MRAPHRVGAEVSLAREDAVGTGPDVTELLRATAGRQVVRQPWGARRLLWNRAQGAGVRAGLHNDLWTNGCSMCGVRLWETSGSTTSRTPPLRCDYSRGAHASFSSFSSRCAPASCGDGAQRSRGTRSQPNRQRPKRHATHAGKR